MAEVNPPEFLGAECYTFQDFRHTFGGVVCVEGVTTAADLAVTAVGGASLNVNVAAGTAWVEGNLNGSSGMYYVENDASVTLTIGANGAGSSRIDRVIATVYDSQYIGTSDSWAIEVVQGVAGAGVPAVPNSTRSGWLELAQVTVPASGGTPSVVTNTLQIMVTCGTNPYVALVASAATSVPNNTDTTITLATTQHNDSAFFTVASSIITVIETGIYDVSGSAGWETAGVASDLEFFISKNTTGVKLANSYAANAIAFAASLSAISFPLTAGDTITLRGYQFSGGALSTKHTAVTQSRLTVRKVG